MRITRLLIGILISFIAGEGMAQLRVEGRYLKDPNGDKLILRGANAMTKYWDADGSRALPELAATNANGVRLFWNTMNDVPLSKLDASIQRAWDLGMVAMPSVWDATGDWSELQNCVDWWFREDVQTMVVKHHDYLLINIANEAGNGSVSKQEWEETYRSIITRFREAGITAPLVIDAANWGRDESYLLERGPALRQHDPEHNLVFSWHPWDTHQPASRYREAMEEAIDLGLCLLVGEFSHVGVFYEQPIDWEALIELCQEHEIGWLYWCWRGAGAGDGHAITTAYDWDSFNQWGWEVAIGHDHSIYKTSRRTPWLGKNVAEDPLPFDRWQMREFSPEKREAGVDIEEQGDPDEDEVSNVWEWAFGWPPLEYNVEAILQLVADGAGGHSLRYPEPKLPEGMLWLEMSDNLAIWGMVETETAVEDGHGFRALALPTVAPKSYRWRCVE